MGLADGFSLAGDYLVENLGLVFPKPASLVFDGARRHVGEDVFADFGEVVVLGDKEYDVVAVFAVGGGRAALFAAQLADCPFVPVAAASVGYRGGNAFAAQPGDEAVAQATDGHVGVVWVNERGGQASSAGVRDILGRFSGRGLLGCSQDGAFAGAS